jgi:formylglycine-generating enzyme required for sulfatase activity
VTTRSESFCPGAKRPPLALLLVACAALGPLAPRCPAADGDPNFKAYQQTIPGTDTTFDMVPIPGGTFKMGSPDSEHGRKADEGPQVQVQIEPFWMGKYEVTWDEYDHFVQAYRLVRDGKVAPVPAGRDADAVSIPTPIWPQDAVPIFDAMGWKGRYPVSDMTQFAAKQYTRWLTKKTGHFYRLPTEAEWEYAARAGTTTAYFFGDDAEKLGQYAWYFDNSRWDDPNRGNPDFNGEGYREVGLKKPNPWGLYDIYGNVGEWVIDQLVADHYKKLAGKPVTWRDAIAWPTTEYPRVVRGGHFDSDPEGCRSAARLGSHPDWKKLDPQIPKSVWWNTAGFMVGLRVVRPLHEPSDQEKHRFWDPDLDIIRSVLAEDAKQARMLVEPPAGK